MSPALVLLIVYSAGLTLFGLWVARSVRGTSDFFVAGRQLTWPLVMVSMLASNIGAGSTVGAAGLAFRDGLGAWWWNGSAAIGSLALAFIVGPRIWRLATAHGFYTAGDFLEFRYGREARGIVSLLLWFGTLAILAGQLIAGAAILEVVAGLPKWAGALLGGLVMTVYFMAGGMLSSVWVNVVQLIVLLTGFIIAVPMVVTGVGGLDALTSAAHVPATFGDFWHSSGPGSGWTLVALLGPAFIVSPGLLQKAYGARSARAVTWGVAANAIALALFAFLPVLLGMAARVAHPDIASPNPRAAYRVASGIACVDGRAHAGRGVLGRGQHVRRHPLHALDVALEGSVQALREARGNRPRAVAHGARRRGHRGVRVGAAVTSRAVTTVGCGGRHDACPAGAR